MKKKNVGLSIITATYNRHDKLIKNLQSVKSQIYKNIEHIIVDNMSNDDTEILVKRYKREVTYKVIYIKEKDKGIYDALNKGILASTGDWIHILHSDDYYTDKNSLINIFKEDYNDINMIANSIIIRKSGQKNSIWNPIFNRKINHYNFPHTGTIIKKSFYMKHGLYNGKYRIISDALHQIKTYGYAKYRIVRKPLIVMESGGASSVMSVNHLKERFILIFRYHKFPFIVKVRFFFSDIVKLFRSYV